MLNNSGQYTIKYDSLDEFYADTDIVESTGDKSIWDYIVEENNPEFTGLSLKEIKKYKYFYKEGLDKLKKIDLNIQLGGTKKRYKWDEEDGDNFSVERLLDGLPSMHKRINNETTENNKNGKFVTLYVNIAELAHVDYEDMLYKSYTAIQIIDYLENMGLKIKVVAFTNTRYVGYYKKNEINLLHVEIVLKGFEDPLIKSLLLTCISPWMLRHHMFKLRAAKFKVSLGMGSTAVIQYENTKNSIYINSRECLSEEASKKKFKELKSIFEQDANNE